jgi:hypothetical protein
MSDVTPYGEVKGVTSTGHRAPKTYKTLEERFVPSDERIRLGKAVWIKTQQELLDSTRKAEKIPDPE